MKARIEIESDNDFDVISPIGTFHAYGADLKHTIKAETEEELRREIVWFLAQLEIRAPYEEEYDMYRGLYDQASGHDQSFKRMIYEAMHKISQPDTPIDFYAGGNRVLTITEV